MVARDGRFGGDAYVAVRVRPARPLDWIELSFAIGLNGSPATRSLYLDWMRRGGDLLQGCAPTRSGGRG